MRSSYRQVGGARERPHPDARRPDARRASQLARPRASQLGAQALRASQPRHCRQANRLIENGLARLIGRRPKWALDSMRPAASNWRPITQRAPHAQAVPSVTRLGSRHWRRPPAVGILAVTKTDWPPFGRHIGPNMAAGWPTGSNAGGR